MLVENTSDICVFSVRIFRPQKYTTLFQNNITTGPFRSTKLIKKDFFLWLFLRWLKKVSGTSQQLHLDGLQTPLLSRGVTNY